MDHITAATLPDLKKLSPRQMQVLVLLAEGKRYEDIATILSIKIRTVKTHVSHAIQNTGFENRTQLIVAFVRWQMLLEMNNGK